MPVWDNQQETSWFSGILEAEGTCNKETGQHTNGGQVIAFTNTDEEILHACTTLLKRWGILHGLYEHKRKEFRKKCTTVSVSGRENCRALLMTLGSNFQCRSEEFNQKLELGSSTTARDAPLTPDLHWFVGLFEGEGWISLNTDKGRYSPIVGIGNTNRLIVEKAATTLHAQRLSWYVYEKAGQKQLYTIKVCGVMRCLRFLRALRGLWRSGAYGWKADKLHEFISSRLAADAKAPYTEAQRQIYRDLREANRKSTAFDKWVAARRSSEGDDTV